MEHIFLHKHLCLLSAIIVECNQQASPWPCNENGGFPTNAAIFSTRDRPSKLRRALDNFHMRPALPRGAKFDRRGAMVHAAGKSPSKKDNHFGGEIFLPAGAAQNFPRLNATARTRKCSLRIATRQNIVGTTKHWRPAMKRALHGLVPIAPRGPPGPEQSSEGLCTTNAEKLPRGSNGGRSGVRLDREHCPPMLSGPSEAGETGPRY